MDKLNKPRTPPQMPDSSHSNAAPNPQLPGESGARQLAFAIAGFLLPLAIFFGWFFLWRALSFAFVLATLLSLMVVSLVVGARFKSSRALKIGATWLFVGCLSALFWALLIDGMA